MADRDVVVFKVIRKPPLGKLAIEVNSIQYEKLADIPAENIKQLVMAGIGDLIVFVDGYDTLVQAGMAPPLVATSPGGQPLPSSMRERQAAFKNQLERQREDALIARSAEIQPVKREPPPKLDDGPDVEINLVEQIDAVFQKYLGQDPELLGRNAGLESAPGGGLRIRVDNRYYSQPKEIEDPKVRRALMMALKEWESGR